MPYNMHELEEWAADMMAIDRPTYPVLIPLTDMALDKLEHSLAVIFRSKCKICGS